MSAPILGDVQIVNELAKLGIEAADVRSAMTGNGPSFQHVLWLFLEKVPKFGRCWSSP